MPIVALPAMRAAIAYSAPAAAASDWWLSGGIDPADVIAHLENPANDGSDNITYSHTSGNELSIVAYANLTSVGSTSYLWHADFLNYAALYASGTFRVEVSDSNYTQNIGSDLTLITVTTDGTDTLWYVDDALYHTFPGVTFDTFSELAVLITTTSANAWPNSVPNFAMYSSHRSLAEVQALYAAVTA